MLEMDNLNRVPSSIEAEKALLCSILLTPKRFDEILEITSSDDFYKKSHQNIFAVMTQIYIENSVIDGHLIIEKLKLNNKYEESGGEATLFEILEAVTTAANILSYAQIVKEKAILRKLGEVGTRIVEMVYDDYEEPETILDKAESMIFKISEKNETKDVVALKDAMHEEMMRLDNVYKNRGLTTGISSGYADFDKMTNGFHPSDLTILAARPAMGKTAFALNLALNVAMNSKKSVLIFSLEMPKSQLAQRLISIDSGVKLGDLRSGFLKDEDLGRIGTSTGRLAASNIFIADTPAVNVLEVRSIARKLKASHSLDIIFIDYLQLLKGTNSRETNRQQEISEISRSLKGIARELNVPIVALSQLSRQVESRPDKRPMLSDLRESGAIEQDADIVMFLYRDEYYNPETEQQGITEVIIGKQRNGSTGTVKLRFFGEQTKFGNLEANEEKYGNIPRF